MHFVEMRLRKSELQYPLAEVRWTYRDIWIKNISYLRFVICTVVFITKKELNMDWYTICRLIGSCNVTPHLNNVHPSIHVTRKQPKCSPSSSWKNDLFYGHLKPVILLTRLFWGQFWWHGQFGNDTHFKALMVTQILRHGFRNLSFESMGLQQNFSNISFSPGLWQQDFCSMIFSNRELVDYLKV